MLRALIVDDEPLARDELIYFLLRSKQVEVIGEADCIEDAFELIRMLQPELIFLDIELAEDSGLQLAEQLSELEQPPAVVFATAYDEYALQAFELNALDYILKPFDEARIRKTLEKIAKLQKIGGKPIETSSAPIRKQMEPTGKLAITLEERIVLIDMEKIIYAGSSEGKTIIRTTDDEYKVAEPLTVLERKLNRAPFARVHRSFVVNVNHITEIQPWFNSTYNLIMKEGSKVPVSRTYVKELKQLLGF